MKMPSKEQILEASKDCPEVKRVLKKLYPEAFEKEWKDVTFLDTKLRLRNEPKEVGVMTEGEDFYMPYNVILQDTWKGEREDGYPVTKDFAYKLVNNRIYRKTR